MKVLIAVDSFKGSLSSEEAGRAISIGIQKVFPNTSLQIIPIADGGEGTVQALVKAVNGKILSSIVTSPIGEKIEASFGILPDNTVVIEMAAASGLTLVPSEKRNPLVTTTYGTGELIKKALDLGAKNIVIGIGGSATNDGGAGMAQALGVNLLDSSGNDLPWGGGALNQLAKIETSNIDSRLSSVNITVICDVDNPLCGSKGASAVYGPQKGATPEMVDQLENNLFHFANIIKEQIRIDITTIPGAGAAGGLGGGLIAFTNANLKPGVEAVLDTVGVDSILPSCDLVITGEGRVDRQSLHGKVPMGVAMRAGKYNVPCIAIVGSMGDGAEDLYSHGLASIIPIAKGPTTLEEAIENAFELTVSAAERAFRLIKLGHTLR